MKHTMKFLSVLLSICMVLGMLPLGAFAAEELCYTVTIGEETTNYTDMDQAIDAAGAATSATLTLHQDLTEYSGSLSFRDGNIILDLNGKTILNRIVVEGSILTIKDSATAKGTVINEGGYAFTYFHGGLIITDSVDAYGETEGHQPWRIRKFYMAEEEVTVGCTGTENIVLPTNVVVVDDDGNEYDTLPSDQTLFFHRHAWSEATCTEPETCTNCGKIAQEALGHSLGSDGACTVCGYDPSKIITINMTDSCGDGWNGNAIKIYENSEEFAEVTLENGENGSWTSSYDSSKKYAFNWVKDSYADECSFEVIISGKTVYTANQETCQAFTNGQRFYSDCDHNYDEGTVTPPTCTEDGFTAYTCQICRDVVIDNMTSALGHSIGSDGTCTVCGYDPSKIITINMTDSYGDGWNGNAIKIYENGEDFAEVTLNDGKTGSWESEYDSSKNYVFKWFDGNYPEECSFEILIDQEVVFTASTNDCTVFGHGEQIYPACNHSLEKVETVAPSCTSYGYTTYTCVSCGGNWEKDQTNALGHSQPEDGITVQEATCTEDGMISYTCTTCGDNVEQFTETALGHTPDDTEPEYTAPTCTGKGFYIYICDRCGASYEEDNGAPLGHTLGDDGNCTVCQELYCVPVYVSGIEITSENIDDILGDGTASYNVQTNTLTLDGYTYEGEENAIHSEIGLNIQLIGNNTISTTQSAFRFDIRDTDVHIFGTGSLEAETDCESIAAENADNVKITVGGGVRLRLQPDNDEAFYMIGCDVELEIKDHAILELGNEDSPLSEECIYLRGEGFGKLTIADHARIYIKTTDEEGIYVGTSENEIHISGSPVINIDADEDGMEAEQIIISGGNITTIGGDNYKGIYTSELIITGGTVIAGTIGNTPADGIEADYVTITGGMLTVSGGGMICGVTGGEIILGEGMVITEPANAIIGQIDLTDYDEGVVLGILNADGTLADSFTIKAADDGEKFDIDVARMVLDKSLKFQFGVGKQKLTELTGLYAVVEKTWADGTVTSRKIPATQWGVTDDYWVISYNDLKAKEMSDIFYITIYNGEGEAISTTKEDAVSMYVARSFDGQTDECKTLMADMLNYGAAAQVYFGYNTDELANSILTQEQKGYASENMAAVANGLVKGENYFGTRLSLDNSIRLQVAFEGLTTDMYAIYSYTDHYGKEQIVAVQGTDFFSDEGVWAIELSKLTYMDARQLIEVTVYNADGTVYGSVTDSMESYICRMLDEDPLYEEIMKFMDSAYAYFH